MPSNATVELLFKDLYKVANFSGILRKLPLTLKLWKYGMNASSKGGSMGTRKRWSIIRQIIQRTSIFESRMLPLLDPSRTILYSYWCMDWVNVLAALRSMHPSVDFITRIHGFDLYEHLPGSAIALLDLQFSQVRTIFTVSEEGSRYLKHHYPQYQRKYEVARLGTRDHGEGPPGLEGPIHIVSCATLIPLKRVYDIVNVLRTTTQPMKWTHFGDGPLFKQLQTKVRSLPGHVQVHLPGRVPNAELMHWYQNHHVDVFLHLSSSEGIPVSIMEAMSFGIPVIATDVGGVSEIVNRNTGILLPADPDLSHVSSMLDRFSELPLSTPEFRRGVRSFWKANYSAEKNYTAFADRIDQLHDSWNMVGPLIAR